VTVSFDAKRRIRKEDEVLFMLRSGRRGKEKRKRSQAR